MHKIKTHCNSSIIMAKYERECQADEAEEKTPSHAVDPIGIHPFLAP